MPAKVPHLSRIWNRRSLIITFAINDLRIRYRNSVLGFLWSVLEPLLILSVLYFVFTNLFKSNVPYYVLYLLLGLIMWNMFTRATSMGVSSIIARGGIVTKVYFPREILPLSSCITSFIMMIFELAVFFAFVIALQFIPPATMAFLPVLLLLEFVLCLGLALPLSVLNVYYRDVQYIWNVLLYAGFFLTPVFYSPDILQRAIRQLFFINPMARIIDMAHNAALYNKMPSAEALAYTAAASFAILLIGYAVFRRYERRVAEEL